MEAQALTTGTVINDRYRIETTLGQGGMGNVYLATHLHLGRPVAIKEMTVRLEDGALQDSALRQFRNEAQILHELNHPQLPHVHDFFIANNNWFLVMDFIRGRTLGQIVDTEDDPLEERQVRQWAMALCDVLEYLHMHKPQVIFRDLKPSNIMLDADGEIRLIDFGISKILDRPGGDGTQTFAKNSGSPGYAAPEQYAHATDQRSDIYSLGATLYTLLSGRTPPPSVMLAAGVVECPPLAELRPGLSESLYQAVAQMMKLHASERPPNIAAVRKLLQARLENDLPLAVPSGPRPKPAASVNDATTTAPLAPPLLPPPPQPEPAAPGVAEPAPPPAAPSGRTAALIGGVALVGVVLVGVHLVTASHSTAPPVVPVDAADLDITTVPSGATVYLNDTVRGTTPLHLEKLTPITYDMRIDASGFQELRRGVSLDNGAHKTLSFTLDKLVYQVTVAAQPDDVSVLVDGQPRGRLGASPLTLGPGHHKLVFTHAGFRSQEKDVTLDVQHPTQSVEVNLEPKRSPST